MNIRLASKEHLATFDLELIYIEENNGHRFVITGYMFSSKASFNRSLDNPSSRTGIVGSGDLHDLFVKAFPQYAYLVKWHLVSTKQPLYYFADSIYFFQNGDFELAKSSAVFGALPNDHAIKIEELDESSFERLLNDRLPYVMASFHVDMVALFGSDEYKTILEHDALLLTI